MKFIETAKNIWKIRPNDVVTITNKLHGCVERNTIVDTLEFGKMEIGNIVDNKILIAFIEYKIKLYFLHFAIVRLSSPVAIE